MEDKDEKKRIIDIIDESIIRFLKNRDEALEEIGIKELFPDKDSFISARELFAERMGVDKNVAKKIFELLYSNKPEIESK